MVRGPLIYGSESARGQRSRFISLARAAPARGPRRLVLGGSKFLHRVAGGFHTSLRGGSAQKRQTRWKGKGVNKLGSCGAIRILLGTRRREGPQIPPRGLGLSSRWKSWAGPRNPPAGDPDVAPALLRGGPVQSRPRVPRLTLCFSPPRPQGTARSPSTERPTTATRPRTTRRSSPTTPSSTRTPWASRARWVSRRERRGVLSA